MSQLSKEQVVHLATSPLYVIYAVASAVVAPEQISRRQIIRAVEYGLDAHRDLGDRIFDLLKMNLHEIYANFRREFPEDFAETCFQELEIVHRVLVELDLPEEQIVDFGNSLYRLARFVAQGELFREMVSGEGMKARAERIECIFNPSLENLG